MLELKGMEDTGNLHKYTYSYQFRSQITDKYDKVYITLDFDGFAFIHASYTLDVACHMRHRELLQFNSLVYKKINELESEYRNNTLLSLKKFISILSNLKSRSMICEPMEDGKHEYRIDIENSNIHKIYDELMEEICLRKKTV